MGFRWGVLLGVWKGFFERGFAEIGFIKCFTWVKFRGTNSFKLSGFFTSDLRWHKLVINDDF